MGRISKREHKTVYQLIREDLGWSRAKASEMLHISENKLEKIETGKTRITPEDVAAMADKYGHPELNKHFCVKECEIGKQLGFSETEQKGLAKIVLEILNSLNTLDNEKNRLIEIAADETITEDEINDFIRIRNQLDNISTTVDSLKLWISKSIAEGTLNSEKLSPR